MGGGGIQFYEQALILKSILDVESQTTIMFV
jgi:hypothetical protein